MALQTVYTLVHSFGRYDPITYRRTVIVDTSNDEVVRVEKGIKVDEALTQSSPAQTASRTPDASTPTRAARVGPNDTQLLDYWRQRSVKVRKYIETRTKKQHRGVRSGSWDVEAVKTVGASTVGDRVRLETEYTVKKVRGRDVGFALAQKYRKYVYVDMQDDSIVGSERPEKIE